MEAGRRKEKKNSLKNCADTLGLRENQANPGLPSLSLLPREKGKRMGWRQFIGSPRLDDLQCHGTLMGFLASEKGRGRGDAERNAARFIHFLII